MKLRLGALTVIGTLAFAASAVAATATYFGGTDGNGTAKIKLSQNGNKIKVPRLVFKNLPAKCNGSANTLDVTISGGKAATLNSKGKFQTKAHGGYSAVHVTGDFNGALTKARGTINLHGRFSDGHHGIMDCHTGNLGWKVTADL